MPVPPELDYAQARDREDELASFRQEFLQTDPETIYLDGNSLGRLPKRTIARTGTLLEHEWGERLVRGWNEGWFSAAERVGAKVASLVGAEPDEVIIADSTSVNLFKLVIAALRLNVGRNSIVTDSFNFPSDIYIMQGAIDLLGGTHTLELVSSADGITVETESLARAISKSTALVSFSHTAFKSGFVYDMQAVTELAHRSGALMLWDLSHSVGAVPVALDANQVDLAIGCTYKYLNGGPGSPAFLYVRRDLQDRLLNPVSGWFGQRGQFDFELEYQPAQGIRRWLTGTPPILSLSAIEPGVDLVVEAGIDRIRQKSIAQTEYLVQLWEHYLSPLGVKLNSPRNPDQRGSHISLGHPEGLRIDRALIERMKVIPDFRYPDNIRLGIAPLYTSFADIHAAILRFRRVLTDRIYEEYPSDRQEVT